MSEVPKTPRDYQAGFWINELRVDPALGVLRGPEGEVRLEPRVLEVLRALARQPGNLVTRRELLDEIWPGGDIYDEALTQCVYQLRQQMASVGGPDFRSLISTVPKRGYLLNAEVRAAAPGSDARDVPPGPRWTRLAYLAGVLALALVLAGVWFIFEWRSGQEAAPASAKMETVAVLPFLPLAEADRDPVLELGMADTLIARLSGIEQIVLQPLTSVRRYAELDRDALRAGRDLGVGAVVDGSIQRSGNAFRVTVRLLRVSDGAALWADTFQDDSTNVFAVQDAICERIAAAIAREIGPQVQSRPARLGTTNPEAYEHYLAGRYVLARFTPSDMHDSIEHFRRAVALDPNYAQAWLGLANVQFRMPIAGEAPPGEYYANARDAVQRALEIDPTLAEGHAMLGWIAHWYEWNWAASEAEFRRAIELDPRDLEGHLGYGHVLLVTGRHDQALVEVRRAREISPFYLIAASLEGFFLTRAGRHEEAIQRLEAARRQNESFWLIRLHLCEAYIATNRYEDALNEARAARQLSGDSTVTMAREVISLARLGRQAEAEALVEEMLRRSAERYVPPYDLAVAYDGVGDAGAALGWLERAYAVRDPKMALLGVADWHTIRGHPGFTDLLERLDLAE